MYNNMKLINIKYRLAEAERMKESLFRPQILRRERIDKLLEAIFDTPLFYLSASMGYGKTTAIKCFLESKQGINTVWIPTARMEQDESWAWRKFIESLKKYNEDAVTKCLGNGLPESDYEIRKVLDIVKEVVKKPLVIVFDDYQNIKDQSILDRILSIYTEYRMPNIHIVVISRMRPTANFLMLNIKGQCMIMWQRELAFTKNETNELFRINGFEVQENQLEELYRYTMGWVAPTYLMLLEYAAHGNIGPMTESLELIKVTVYDQLDKAAQRILMMLAPIESFSIELSEYVTEDIRVREVLKEMLANNCFINYNAENQEYQFHTIFKFSLMEELKKSGIEEKRILNRCARWHEINGNMLRAIEYYDKAENSEAILDIMSRAEATEYFNAAPKLMIEVFKHISLEKKLLNPMGYLSYILSYLVVENRKEALNLLEEVEAFYLEHTEIENWQHIMGEIYLIKCYSMVNDLNSLDEYAMKAYNCLKGNKSQIYGQNVVFTRGNIHICSLFYITPGKYKEIRDFLVDKFTYFKYMTNGCTAGAKYLVRAEYAYDIGELEEARILANKSIYKAETKKQLTVTLNAYLVLMRISLVQGKVEEIEGYISELEHLAANNLNPTIHLQIEMIKTYIYGMSGQYEKIPEWFKNFDMKDGMDHLPNLIVTSANLGMTLLCKEKYMQLEVFMEAFIEELRREKIVYPMIYVYILMAIARLQLYDEEEAMDTLMQAVEIAEPDGIIMPFIEYGGHIKMLLEILSKRSEFVNRILQRYLYKGSVENKGIGQVNRINSLLTDREKEVMKLFTKGYKQSEIANELQITVDTVKRHIKNVYSKMDIHSKAELIEKIGNVI